MKPDVICNEVQIFGPNLPHVDKFFNTTDLKVRPRRGSYLIICRLELDFWASGLTQLQANSPALSVRLGTYGMKRRLICALMGNKVDVLIQQHITSRNFGVQPAFEAISDLFHSIVLIEPLRFSLRTIEITGPDLPKRVEQCNQFRLQLKPAKFIQVGFLLRVAKKTGVLNIEQQLEGLSVELKKMGRSTFLVLKGRLVEELVEQVRAGELECAYTTILQLHKLIESTR